MGAPQRAFPSADLPYGLWVASLARTGKPELLTRPAPQCNLSDTDHLYDKKQHGCQVQSFQLHCSQRTAHQLQCNKPPPQTSTNFNTQTPSFPYELAKSTQALPPAHTWTCKCSAAVSKTQLLPDKNWACKIHLTF